MSATFLFDLGFLNRRGNILGFGSMLEEYYKEIRAESERN